MEAACESGERIARMIANGPLPIIIALLKAAVPQIIEPFFIARFLPRLLHLRPLRHAGFARPEFVRLKSGAIDPASDICQRKLDRLRPWAWGPDSVELFEPLFPQVTGVTRTEPPKKPLSLRPELKHPKRPAQGTAPARKMHSHE